LGAAARGDGALQHVLPDRPVAHVQQRRAEALEQRGVGEAEAQRLPERVRGLVPATQA